MKKIVLGIFALLVFAAPAVAGMMWTSTDLKPRVTLKYVNPDNGAVVMRNYSSTDATFFELHRDNKNRHYIFFRAENKSGMVLNLFGLGMGRTSVKGTTDAVLCQQANLPAPKIDFSDGMEMTPSIINMKGSYAVAVDGMARGSFAITAIGTLNFYSTPIPAMVTLAPSFKSLTRQADTVYPNDDEFTSDFTPVSASNFPPTAKDFSYTVDFGIEKQMDFIADGDAYSFQPGGTPPDVIISSDGPSNGKATTAISGKSTYRPDRDFDGVDVLHYSVEDAAGLESATHRVVLTVSPAPVAKDIIQQIEKDSAATAIDFTSLGLGPGVSVTGTSSITGATAGALGASSPYTYTPAKGFTGTDTFNYMLSAKDTAWEATGKVIMQVTPVAVDDYAVLVKLAGLTLDIPVLVNDFTKTGAITVDSVTAPKNGTAAPSGDNGSVIYVLTNTGATEDYFTYVIKTDTGKTSAATVKVVIK